MEEESANATKVIKANKTKEAEPEEKKEEPEEKKEEAKPAKKEAVIAPPVKGAVATDTVKPSSASTEDFVISKPTPRRSM